MRCSTCTLVVVILLGRGTAVAGEPVALRVESLTVPPSSGPLIRVQIKNLLDAPYEGSLSLKGPQPWQIVPQKREVSLPPGETQRVPFTLERGLTLKANSYPVEVSATGAGATVVRKQDLACASAPYFKPTIDGDPSEWKDAVPVTFTTGGSKTIISTYWNRRQFSILVAVEEQKLIGYSEEVELGAFDVVQVAVSPQDTKTGSSPEDDAARFEFLLVSTGQGASGKCFQLATPGMKLAEAAKARRLGPLHYKEAQVAVSRTGTTTYYECGLPWSPMREQIRPSEGREFCLSVLVHDPDGTGIRDWGSAAGLWPWQRNRRAWSLFAGAKWGKQPPFDNKLPWGLCSSTY